MRIVIDLQGAQSESRFRGIGRYSLSIAKAIARNREEHEVLIVLSNLFSDTIEDIKKEFEDLLPTKNIKVWNAVGPVKECEEGNDTRREVSEIIREVFLINLKPDFVFITSLFEGYVDDAITSIHKIDNSVRVAVIGYDLIPYIHQDKYLTHNESYKKHYLKKIEYLKKANLILGISQSSCREIIENLSFKEENIVNVSSSVDASFKSKDISNEDKQKLLKKFNITKKTILYTPGGFDVRKNFENLIIAYSKLPSHIQNFYQLVIVSKVDDGNRKRLYTLAKEKDIKQDNLILTGYVADEELINFYRVCDLFVFASIHEGFGLPVLEAMNCGALVIGSNTTSVPEVIGHTEALFDPYSVESIANKIEEILENEELKQKLLKYNRIQVKKFSWDKSAKIVIGAMEKSHLKGPPTVSTKYDNIINAIADALVHHDEDNNLLENISKSLYQNRLETRQKTLWIDVTQIRLQDFATGIQRVVKSVLKQIFNMRNLEYDIKLIYLEYGVHSSNAHGWVYRFASKYQSKISKKSVFETDYIVEPITNDIFLGLDLMSLIVDAEKENLFTNWKNIGVKINFVVYDILPILHPQWWPNGGGNTHTRWLNTVLNISDNIISISKAVSNEVQLYAKKNKIETKQNLRYSFFHLGADINNSQPSSELPQTYTKTLAKIKEKTSFIMVGTLEPRKGHLQTLESFTALWKDGIDINLVIVGKEGWLVDNLVKKLRNHPQLNKQLFWLEGISDEYLEEVYAASSCLIAASEGEGFGLPLIEAAQHKKPIIARDIPVFKEVAGEYAYYFDNDNNPLILADTIKKWLELYKNDKHPKSDDMPWLTWKESSEQLISRIVK